MRTADQRRVPELEFPEPGAGLQVLRLVIDGVQHCNLRCTYCHPGEVWKQQHLPAPRIAEMFAAADRYGLLEVVLSGGEITLHPDLPAILQATHLLRRPGSALITNATLLTGKIVTHLRESNLTRICVSVDGIDNTTHGSARGKNFKTVWRGLEAVQAADKPVTVISVAHQGNYRRLLELSELLADSGLATQHHLCAPSFSGEAREHYPALKLEWADYFALQEQIDAAHAAIKARGLFVTFNSFWPATGERGVPDAARSVPLQQLVEQTKDTLLHLRPNGQLRLAAVAWGRETVGAAEVGAVHRTDPQTLLAQADRRYRDGSLGQLPREVEAQHKFQLGPVADETATNRLIDSDADPSGLTSLVPIRTIAQSTLLANPIDWPALHHLAQEAASRPQAFRFVRAACGVHLLYDRTRARVTLLTAAEWQQFLSLAGDRPS